MTRGRVVVAAPALILLLWLGAACSSATAAGPSATATGPSASTAAAGEVFAPGTASAAPGGIAQSAAAPSGMPQSGAAPSGTTAVPSTAGPDDPTTGTAPSPIRQGSQAATSRVRFVPGQIELPSGKTADVEPEPTVDGVLQIPVDVEHVGWWDGSSAAGDPFGATVLAGHVDSREQGLGFFAELLLTQVGDVITVRSDSRSLSYRVVSTTLVDKQALASDSQVLDQRGPHRLVLVTCSGQWHPDIRSYDSNLIVVADPVQP